jgi:hypothetical protein
MSHCSAHSMMMERKLVAMIWHGDDVCYGGVFVVYLLWVDHCSII